MKVALLTLTRGSVSGGYAKYLREIVPRLRGHHDVQELRVYVPPRMAGEDVYTWPEMSAFSLPRWLRREITSWGADVVFIPSSVHLDFGPTPVVTMVRNMEPLERPFRENTVGEGLKNVVRAIVAARASRRSERVIAVSEHVRDFIVRRWKLDPAKVATVPHGVEVPATQVRPSALREGVPFVFTAGSIRPARGLEDVVGSVPESHVLAVAGDVSPGAERYARTVRELGPEHRVQWLGALSPQEMAWCFRHASAFVMTSRAEACPNTVLEALAHGCLSVSTDQPPMPEFYGDAALYYTGGEAADCARVLRQALALDGQDRELFRTRALRRISKYTWAATVERTVAVLRDAIDSRGR